MNSSSEILSFADDTAISLSEQLTYYIYIYIYIEANKLIIFTLGLAKIN